MPPLLRHQSPFDCRRYSVREAPEVSEVSEVLAPLFLMDLVLALPFKSFLS
nr:MAG TPA: hypothetical protein [Caudoviricetes sp.]